jgi:hypothetical protein
MFGHRLSPNQNTYDNDEITPDEEILLPRWHLIISVAMTERTTTNVTLMITWLDGGRTPMVLLP